MLAVAVIAILLRLWPIAWGWPHHLYGDEVNYAPNALRMAADRTLDPGGFHNSHLLTYLLLIEVGLVYVAGLVAGVFRDAADYGQFVWTHASVFTVLGRLTSMAFGVGTVLVTVAAGGKLRLSAGWSAIGALMLAIAPLHAYYSKVGTNDVCMTFFVSMALLCTLEALQRTSRTWLVIAAFCAGLAAGAKYNGGVAILMPLIGLRWCTGAPKRLSSVLFGAAGLAATAGVGFAVSNPYSILAFDRFVEGFLEQARLGAAPWPGQQPGSTPYLIAVSLSDGLGWTVVMLSMLGLLTFARRRTPGDVVLLAFVLAYAAVLSQSRLFGSRFMLPAYPPLAIAAAVGMQTLTDAGRRRLPWPGFRVAVVILTGVIVLQPWAATVRANVILARGDTRVHARQWVDAHATNQRVVADFDAAAAFEEPLGLERAYTLFAVHRDRLAPEWPCDRLRTERVTYVVLSAGFINATTSPDPARAFMACLEAHGQVVETISPFTGRVGPETEAETVDVLQGLGVRRFSGPVIRIFALTTDR